MNVWVANHISRFESVMEFPSDTHCTVLSNSSTPSNGIALRYELIEHVG